MTGQYSSRFLSFLLSFSLPSSPAHHRAQCSLQLSAMFPQTRLTGTHHATLLFLITLSHRQNERYRPLPSMSRSQTRSKTLPHSCLSSAPVFLCWDVWKQGCFINECFVGKTLEQPASDSGLVSGLHAVTGLREAYRGPVAPRTSKPSFLRVI